LGFCVDTTGSDIFSIFPSLDCALQGIRQFAEKRDAGIAAAEAEGVFQQIFLGRGNGLVGFGILFV
jgi:hypothetical protein